MKTYSKNKRILKIILAYFLYYTGLIFILSNLRLKNKCIVLVYHRVVSPLREIYHVQDGMYVEPHVFKQHLDYLASHFNIISEKEFIDTLRKKKRFNKACLITFDDGWRDNFQYAFPLLKEKNIPATIFLATGLTGTSNWFWPEKILYFVENINLKSLSKIEDKKIRKLIEAYHKNNEKEESHLNKLIEYLKSVPEEKLEYIIGNLSEMATKTISDERQVLDWDEIKEMMNYSISFGSHTVNHKILTNNVDIQKVRFELEVSKRTIENKIDSKVRSFCFPNGNFNDLLIGELEKANYDLGFIGGRGVNDSKTDPFRVKRIGIHNDVSYNSALFACRLLFPIF